MPQEITEKLRPDASRFISIEVVKRIIEATRPKNNRLVSPDELREALERDQEYYFQSVAAASLPLSVRVCFNDFAKKLHSVQQVIANLSPENREALVAQLSAIPIQVEDNGPAADEVRELADEKGVPRQRIKLTRRVIFNNNDQRAHVEACLQSWQMQTDALLTLIDWAPAEAFDVRKIKPKNSLNAFSINQSVSLLNRSKKNRYRIASGPEVHFIAYDLYTTYQFVFGEPVTWSNETQDGPAVRFALSTLKELGIPHPIANEVFTRAQIVAIWERHCGRSNGDGRTSSTRRTARRRRARGD